MTFTAPDGRYMWYTMELQSASPPCEKEILIQATLRAVVAVEIPISNPASTSLAFSVFSTGEGLLGDESVTVPPGETVMYELLYSPLKPGEGQGTVSFVHPVAGEFWYRLKLVAEEATPVALPLLSCSVGGRANHTFTLSNPLGEEVTLHARVDNSTNFRLEAEGGGAIVMPPYGEATAKLTFTPSQLDEASFFLPPPPKSTPLPLTRLPLPRHTQPTHQLPPFSTPLPPPQPKRQLLPTHAAPPPPSRTTQPS